MDNGQFDKPVYSLKLKGKYGLSDNEGKIIYPCNYSQIRSEYECENPQFISISIGKKKGIGDVNGKIILEAEFENIICGMFNDKIYFIGWKSKKAMIYNADGTPFNNKQYDGIDWEGYDFLAMVKNGNSWFYLKGDGSEVSIDE